MEETGGSQEEKGQNPQEKQNSGNEGLTYESWYTQQPKEVQILVNGQIEPMKHRLNRANEEKAQLKRDIEAIKAKTDLDAPKKLEAMEQAHAEAERRASFYEGCPREVVNPKAAYTLAKEFGHLTEKGHLDIEKFKEAFPEQFQSSSPNPTTSRSSGAAGAGTAGAPTPAAATSGTPMPNQQMNAAIRTMAGRNM